MKGLHYTVGLSQAGKDIQVRFAPNSQEWLFLEMDAQGVLQEIRRQPLAGIDFTTLTGLPKPENPTILTPIQLT